MSVEQKFIELLSYMRDRGIVPDRFNAMDRFLNPFTRRIARGYQLKPHQRAHVLWIPTEKGIKPHFPDIKLESCRGTIIATTKSGFLGAGVGESEAILSLVQDHRRQAA
jgi:hypothetical protein